MCGHDHHCTHECKTVAVPEYIEVDIGHKNIWCRLWKTRTDIEEAVNRVAKELTFDYANKNNVVMLITLKGASYFGNDLVRRVQLPFITQEYVWCSSYTVKGVPDGPPTICFVGAPSKLVGKSVIVVDDIMDTGATMEHLFDELVRYGVRDIKTCCLVHKTASKISVMKPNYVGFEAPELKSEMYLVGYGMDYNELFRGMNDIYWFHKDTLKNDFDPNKPLTNMVGFRNIGCVKDELEYKKVCLHEM